MDAIPALAGVTYRPENTLVPDGDAITKYFVARLNLEEMAESAISCRPRSNKRAVFTVEFYGPKKGVGPAEAQNFMSDVMCRIGELKVINVNSPDFTALDETPYYFARVSFDTYKFDQWS